MSTFAELNIKVNSDAKQTTSDLKALETQAAQTEKVVASYANATIILSQRQKAAYEAEKVAQTQLLTQKLAQLAEMKRVEEQVYAQHKAMQDQIATQDRARLAQQVAAEKAAADKIAQLRKQAYLGGPSASSVQESPGAAAARQQQYAKEKQERIQAKLEEEKALKTLEQRIADSANEILAQNARQQRAIQEKITADYRAEIEKRKALYANMTAAMSSSRQTSQSSRDMISGMTSSAQSQAQNQAEAAALRQRTALYNNMTAVMSRSNQTSEASRNIINGMSNSYRQQQESINRINAAYQDQINRLTMTAREYHALQLAQQGFNNQQIQGIQNLTNYSNQHTMLQRVLTKSLAI